jgi:transposase-like protein
VLTCLAASVAEAGLAAGSLTCPSCGSGRLARWGYGRERTVTLPGGRRVAVRPRRARCTACEVTHVIVPAWCAPRRAHGLEVIGTAAAAALAGHGHRAIGAGLAVPAATVRGWLRRLRARAEQLRCHALGQLAVFGGDRADHMGPSGPPPGRRAGRAGRCRGRGPAPPARLRRAGPDLAAAGPAGPGRPSHARPRRVIISGRSRAPACPAARPATLPVTITAVGALPARTPWPCSRHHDHQPPSRCPECPILHAHRQRRLRGHPERRRTPADRKEVTACNRGPQSASHATRQDELTVQNRDCNTCTKRIRKAAKTVMPVVISLAALTVSILAYNEQHNIDEAASTAEMERNAQLVSAWVTFSPDGAERVTVQNLGTASITEVTVTLDGRKPWPWLFTGMLS